MKFRFGYDDSLDVVGVHLVGGIVGSLLLGFFADAAVNPAVAHEGVFSAAGAGRCSATSCSPSSPRIVCSFVVTFVIVKVLDAVMPGGVRVTEEDEETGLDLTQHSEIGYALERV